MAANGCCGIARDCAEESASSPFQTDRRDGTNKMDLFWDERANFDILMGPGQSGYSEGGVGCWFALLLLYIFLRVVFIMFVLSLNVYFSLCAIV